MKRWNMIRMLISPSRDFGFVSHTMPTSKSHPVPAFYDANEPLLLSMLSSQTEICYQPKTLVRVSAMEEIQSRTSKHDNFSHRIIYTQHNILKV